MRTSRIVPTLFGLLIAAQAAAVPPLVTGDVPTAGRGLTEVFVGSLSKTSPSGDSEVCAPWAEVVYGVSDRQEVTFEIAHVTGNPRSGPSESGVGDIVIGTKFLLGPMRPERVSFAMSVEAKLDNGDCERGLGSGNKDYDFRLRAQREIGRNEFVANLGYIFVGDPRTPRGTVEARNVVYWTAAICHKASSRLTLLGEVYGREASEPGGEPRLAFGTGVNYKMGQRQWLHFSWGSSLRHEDAGGPRSRLYVGMKVVF